MSGTVEFRSPALVFIVVGAVCFALKRAVVRWQPAALERVFGRGEAA